VKAVGRFRGGRIATAAALLVAITAVAAGAADPARIDYVRVRMGMPFRISVYSDDEAAANAAADAAFRRVKELNDTFSDYDPRSETSRLVKAAVPGKAMPVSRDMLTVLQRAEGFSEQSAGAFDVTVGPAVKLWRLARRKKEKPTAEQLAEVRSLIGYRQLRLDAEASTVTFERAGMQLDFGGIVTGYACDEIVRIFKERGLTRVLVDASGDIACGDPPPGKEGWTIGIGSLAKPDAAPERFIRVANCAVETSGDAYQYVEFDGVRYGHIVDPKTGLGLTTRSSVTVIAPDCTTADALSTAAVVLGPEKGIKLIEKYEGAEMLGVFIGPEGVEREVVTEGFERREVRSEN
jgi:FAD:protein FMN transferase